MYLHTWVFTSKDAGVDLESLFKEFCLKHGIELQSSCGDDPTCVTTEGLPAGMKEEKRVLTVKQVETGFEQLLAQINALDVRVTALEP